MKVRTVWLGRPAASPFDQQVEKYRKQVHRRWPAEDRPLRPVRGGREGDPARALRLEAEAITRHHEPGWLLVALDETGRFLNSVDFAKRLADLEATRVRTEILEPAFRAGDHYEGIRTAMLALAEAAGGEFRGQGRASSDREPRTVVSRARPFCQVPRRPPMLSPCPGSPDRLLLSSPQATTLKR